MENIFICNIQVDHLFWRINYNIDLPSGNPISIITAPNGMGKTTILNLLSMMFHPQTESFRAIREIPFAYIKCTLSNGKVVELKRLHMPGSPPPRNRSSLAREQTVDLLKNILGIYDYEFSISGASKQKLIYSKAFQDALMLNTTDLYALTENEEDVLHSKANNLYFRLRFVWKQQKEYLAANGCHIPINYIRADRIQPVQESLRHGDSVMISPLTKACETIEKRIKAATDDYNEAVSRAKDRLPVLFLNEAVDALPHDRFMDAWVRYKEELTQFQKIGLIPISDSIFYRDISEVYDDKKQFLSTYLEAFKDTTDKLDDIYRRLYLFKSILDERNAVTRKSVSFNKGQVQISSGGFTLDLSSLSSGEKHDFIMFFNLIFDSAPGSLVLIDEPEISLHIEWQETFLDHLEEICSMNHLTAIVATHSPNIISSHFMWVVDKGASEE